MLTKNVFKIIFILCLSLVAHSKVFQIAVLDTGFKNELNVPICDSFDFTNSEGGTVDDNHCGHGTNIVGIIKNELKDLPTSSYCFILYKTFNDKCEDSGSFFRDGLFSLLTKNPDIINYSGGGENYSASEAYLIKRLLANGSTFVSAAGNENNNLDKNCNYFPACSSPNIIMVGNGQDNEHRYVRSNYGKRVSVWEVGVNKCVLNICMSGTSQATAIHTGKLIREMILKDLKKRKPSSSLSTNIPSIEEPIYSSQAEYEDAFRTTGSYIYQSTELNHQVDNKVREISEGLPQIIKDIVEVFSHVVRTLATGSIEIKGEF